jgi:SulP family sulfate permease
VHSVALLGSALFLGAVIGQIPLAALAGVLMVTAWRMNEWESIRFIFSKRFKTAMIAFAVTMLATITLDLTEAILIGTFVAGGIFLSQIANIDIDVQEVEPDKLRARGIEANGRCKHVKVAFVTGPVFFAATDSFNEAFANLGDTHALILSMRGVPLIDTAGLEAIAHLREKLHKRGGTLMFAGVHENAKRMMERAGLEDEIGRQNFFWSSDQAIVQAERQSCRFCQ